MILEIIQYIDENAQAFLWHTGPQPVDPVTPTNKDIVGNVLLFIVIGVPVYFCVLKGVFDYLGSFKLAVVRSKKD